MTQERPLGIECEFIAQPLLPADEQPGDQSALHGGHLSAASQGSRSGQVAIQGDH